MDVLQQPLQTANHVNLFHEFEYDDDDDDVFYSELRKQVLQLTAEDDDDQVYATKKSDMPVKARQPDLNNPSYYSWPEREIRVAPAWILNIGGTGNGTGVFIPQTVQSRRRHRSRRKKNEKRSKQAC